MRDIKLDEKQRKQVEELCKMAIDQGCLAWSIAMMNVIRKSPKGD